MSEPINNYKMRKLVYQIIFNFYETNYDEDPSVYDLIVIESLRNVVEGLVSNNYLSKNVINNINNFLSQARDYKDGNREKRIEFINEIIRLMNSEEKDDSLIFYRLQLYDRTKEFKYLFKANDSEIRKEIENIHDSICNDLYVLVSHTEEINDMEFVNEFLPYLKDSDIYYESINYMLKENPIVFKDKTFYNRMICVLEYNNIMYEDLVEYNAKLIKKINKKIKKYK